MPKNVEKITKSRIWGHASSVAEFFKNLHCLIKQIYDLLHCCYAKSSFCFKDQSDPFSYFDTNHEFDAQMDEQTDSIATAHTMLQ